MFVSWLITCNLLFFLWYMSILDRLSRVAQEQRFSVNQAAGSIQGSRIQCCLGLAVQGQLRPTQQYSGTFGIALSDNWVTLCQRSRINCMLEKWFQLFGSYYSPLSPITSRNSMKVPCRQNHTQSSQHLKIKMWCPPDNAERNIQNSNCSLQCLAGPKYFDSCQVLWNWRIIRIHHSLFYLQYYIL